MTGRLKGIGLVGLLAIGLCAACGPPKFNTSWPDASTASDSGGDAAPRADASPDAGADTSHADGGAADANVDALPGQDAADAGADGSDVADGGSPSSDASDGSSVSSDVGSGLDTNPAGDGGTEICNDGIDNNGNNLIDCSDPQCASSPFCQFDQQDLPPGEQRQGDIRAPSSMTQQGQDYDTNFFTFVATANEKVKFTITVHHANTLQPLVGVWTMDQHGLPLNNLGGVRSQQMNVSFQVTFATAGNRLITVDDSRNVPADNSIPSTFYGGPNFTYTIRADIVH